MKEVTFFERVVGGGAFRDGRRICLWLPESTLHRVQGDWVLQVDEDLTTAGNTGRRRSQPGKRTKRVLLPVHSLGVPLLPSCCQPSTPDSSARILVRIDPSEVPKRLRYALTPSRLRGGGPLGTAQRPSCTYRGAPSTDSLPTYASVLNALTRRSTPACKATITPSLRWSPDSTSYTTRCALEPHL